MTWFKKHLNLTWMIITLLQFTTVMFESPTPFIIARVTWLITTIWVLHRKKRCWAWVIFPISVLFLENKREEIVHDLT